MHGRIYSSALVHRQMITAMFAGILASSASLLMPARSTVSFKTPALLGIARHLCALGPSDDADNCAIQAIGRFVNQGILTMMLSLVLRVKPLYWVISLQGHGAANDG